MGKSIYTDTKIPHEEWNLKQLRGHKYLKVCLQIDVNGDFWEIKDFGKTFEKREVQCLMELLEIIIVSHMREF